MLIINVEYVELESVPLSRYWTCELDTRQLSSSGRFILIPKQPPTSSLSVALNFVSWRRSPIIKVYQAPPISRLLVMFKNTFFTPAGILVKAFGKKAKIYCIWKKTSMLLLENFRSLDGRKLSKTVPF